MNVPLTSERKTRAMRAWKWVKWFLATVALLIVVNWAGAWWLASSNQRKMDAFQEEVGAASLRELAGAKHVELVFENGWHFYMAALACIDPEIEDVFYPGDDEDAPEPTEAQRAAREAQLDRAHPFVAEARGFPRSVAVLHYDDPLNMRMPHTWAVTRYVRLACSSARDHQADGDGAKATERLLDALAMSEGTTRLPTLLGLLVRAAAYDNLFNTMAPHLDRLSEESLRQLTERMQPIDMRAGVRKALAGEVFFGLSCWEWIEKDPGLVMGERLPFWLRIGYVSLLLELDKRAYLNRMIPLALDPTPENSSRIAEDRPPFYAVLTKLTFPATKRVIQSATRSHRVVVMLREALRLELERRESGELPAPRREIDGVKIDVRESADAITLSAPSPNDEKPVTITLPR